MAAALTALAGALIAVQARVNGALTDRLGNPVLAALVSFGVGLVALLAIVAVRRRGHARRPPAAPRTWWWFAGGFGGAFLVAASAAAVPAIGVALLAVATVAGQTTGSLVVDRVGLSPRGHQPLTVPRVAGALLAVAGIAVAALGRSGDPRPLLLAVVALAGFGAAGQQAANGHLHRRYGDAFAAALVNFVVGTAVLAAIVGALAATGNLGTPDWPANVGLYLGGLCGATYIAVAAAVVGRLGVLRLTLATVAGQMVGSVLLDAFAPAAARLDVATLLAAVLTLVAVAVAGRSRAAR